MKLFPTRWGRWTRIGFGLGFVGPALIGLPLGILPNGFALPEALGIGLWTGALAGFIGRIIDRRVGGG